LPRASEHQALQEYRDFAVRDLSGPTPARRLISWVLSQPLGQSIGLDFEHTDKVYPNGAVPFACALDFLKERGHTFHIAKSGHERSLPHVLDPMDVADDPDHTAQLTDVVWKYRNEKEAGEITRRFMGSLLDRMPCEEGVYDTLNWCIYEVLDNVFQHSQAACGYVMMQLHTSTRQCVISVSDSGIGIHRAMGMGAKAGRFSYDSIKTADQAIGLAVQQGVTSKGNLNQGNGLFGLSRSVDLNGGSLSIHSGKGTWTFKEHEVAGSTSDAQRPLLDLESHHGTTVDWQLNCRTKVSIGEALGSRFSSSDLLESIETIDGFHELDAAELESSIGSRKEGIEIRTRIMNYLSAGVPQIVLNMTHLDTISSSFADEVLGRLAVQLGEAEFANRIAIRGASTTNRQIIALAVELRIKTEGDGDGST
jgi:hypothetical protein